MNTYTPVNWEDSPSVVTPLDAEHLNQMDEGIANAFEDINTLDTNAKTEAAKVTQAQADIETLKATTTGLDYRVKTNATEVAKKANIADVYKKTEVDTLLDEKIDSADVYNTDEADNRFLKNFTGAVGTDNLAAKAVTSEKIAAGAVTSTKIGNNAVGTSNIADNSISATKLMSNSVSTEKITNYAVTLEKLGTDVNAKLDSKYDGNNVEAGTGSLTCATQSVIDANLIQSASFEYQKTGKIVTIFIYIGFNAGNISYVQFKGLPFAPDTLSNQNRVICSTNKSNTNIVVYPVGSWLTLNFTGTKTLQQDEVIKFPLTIMI